MGRARHLQNPASQPRRIALRFRLVSAGEETDLPADASPPDPIAAAPARPAVPVEEILAGARPAVDLLERAVLRARAERALFGASVEPPRIGRYALLERAGAGGMGVVWAAYDPDLDRAVAIKLVAADSATARARVLAEGQALARLSHPNVVPVFDVGLYDEQVYLVMELVRGATLRAHVAERPRSAREIAQIYRQAGEGLAAAHRAGLVHRDFKPDNAIVGSDGRVRVLDFGLARPADPDESAEQKPVQPGIGTPRYMAPEQASGEAISAAADQYAFCVSLREALAEPGGAPGRAVPRWLEAIVARGTQADPAARFPSMDEVTRALGRDPRVVLRNRLLVLGALALVGGAFATGRAASPPESEAATCEGGRPAIEAVWGPGQRGAVVDRLAADADPYARQSAPRIATALDGYRDRWAAGHRDACMAHRRGEQSAALLDRRMACLHRGKLALGATVDVLAAARGASLPGALVALGDLPDLARCGDPEALLTSVAPPPPGMAHRVAAVERDLERAQVLLAAARPEARQLAVDAVASARRLGYRPLLARALLVLGHIEIATSRREEAVAPLDEATTLALAVGDDAVAVESFARRAWVEGTDVQADHDRALAGLPLVEALASRLGPAGQFARAMLHNNLGGIELSRGRRPEAREALERAAVEARDVTGAGSIELAKVPAYLGLVTDDARQRGALFNESIAELSSAVGHDHPMTLDVRIMAGVFTANPRQSAEMLEPACRAYTAMHPTYGRKAAECWFELGLVALDRADAASVRAAMGEVVKTAANGGDPERIALARAHLALARGDGAAAAAGFGSLERRLGEQADLPWWMASIAADAELGAALARRLAGDHRAAERSLERASARLEQVMATQPVVRIQRRLARVRAELARLRAARRAPPDAIAPLVRAAADWYSAAGGYAERVAELAALTAAYDQGHGSALSR
jgi:hypothetical protein